jgi:REP element-mobilizing transposase RayT
MRYFITFACYGTHLHGGASGSVDRHHNHFGGRLVEPDRPMIAAAFHRMSEPPNLLHCENRGVVLEALREVCSHRGWILFAAHVRSTHVHVVVEGEAPPEKMMKDFKAYASRALNRVEGPRWRWARHGSTRWLWLDEDVRAALRYVVEEQGEPMAVLMRAGA